MNQKLEKDRLIVPVVSGIFAMLPDADFDADEFEYIFGTDTPSDTESFRNTVELIKQAGGSFPSQDE